MRKVSGHDAGKLYAMKVLKKATIVQKAKTAEHTRTERQVLEHIRQSPFLVTLHYAFQTDTKLHLILGQDILYETAFHAQQIDTVLCLYKQKKRLMIIFNPVKDFHQLNELVKTETSKKCLPFAAEKRSSFIILNKNMTCIMSSIIDYVNGGELFTHLVQRVRFKEQEVALYSGEIVLALEHLHKVTPRFNTIKASCLFRR